MVYLPNNDDDPDDGECQLLGPFAILVQMALAAVALLALLMKRQREHPRRPFQVWYCRPINLRSSRVLI